MSADRDTDTPTGDDELDRHRRRVLWALPTGLYLIGSRHGEDVNLMAANLVVQVCMEPKLVGVALERDSVTAGLVAAGGGFTVSLLARSDRDVVRRFVKPVKEVDRAPDGALLALSGHPVTEVGPGRRPVLASAAGYLDCRLTSRCPSGATRSASVRSSGSAVSPQRCCAWRTPVCTTAGEPLTAPRSGRSARSGQDGRPRRRARRGSQVDPQRQDAVDQLRLGVPDHGEVREVPLGLLTEALALGALDRRHPALRTASARARNRATISCGSNPGMAASVEVACARLRRPDAVGHERSRRVRTRDRPRRPSGPGARP